MFTQESRDAEMDFKLPKKKASGPTIGKRHAPTRDHGREVKTARTASMGPTKEKPAKT